jgi:hypothetical protein
MEETARYRLCSTAMFRSTFLLPNSYLADNNGSERPPTWQKCMLVFKQNVTVVRFKPKSGRTDKLRENSKHEIARTWKSVQWKSRCSVRTHGMTKLKAVLRATPLLPPKKTEDRTPQYVSFVLMLLYSPYTCNLLVFRIITLSLLLCTMALRHFTYVHSSSLLKFGTT